MQHRQQRDVAEFPNRKRVVLQHICGDTVGIGPSQTAEAQLRTTVLDVAAQLVGVGQVERDQLGDRQDIEPLGESCLLYTSPSPRDRG